MSAKKAKPKPKGPVLPVPLKQWVDFLRGQGRTAALVALTVAAFAGLWYAGWREVGDDVLASKEYWLVQEHVHITPPPPWVHRDVRFEVFRDGSLEGPLSIMDDDLAQRIADTYHVGRELGDQREVQVVNVRRPEAIRHVTSAGAELVLSLVEKIGRRKRPVHIGLGAGYSAMMVARHLADRIRSDPDCPGLVLHALSAGGFQVDKPQRSPITYFNYFDGALTKVDFVALFSHTIVPNDDYERIRKSPGVQKAFERADEIDIVVTSFAWAHDEHGMLRQFLKHLVDAGELESDTIRRMLDAGWTGDVQFRPYSATGPILEECPVRAVTLFELSDLARIAHTEGKHVVLLARPCGECGTLKTEALRPLLTEPSLRLWTHLVVDVDTAGALLKSPNAADLPVAAPEPTGAPG